MLKVRDLEAGYGDIQVIWGLSLSVDEGAIVALLGSNGAGKTTTLNAVMGLLPSMGGEIRFRDTRLNQRPTYDIVNLGLGMVPETQGIFTTLTVAENLELGAFPARARAHRKQSLAQVFETFPRLADRQQQIAGTLSGGERRMLAIARALMTRPDMLILDEPSLGLAPIIVEELFAVIERINTAGMTILLVEQNVHMSLDLAQYVYVIENGRLVTEGTGEAMRHDSAIQEAYLGL